MMPLARAALGTWRGSRGNKSRVGMVPQVIYFFAYFCVQQKQFDAAAAVLLQFDLFARPSEVLNLKRRDLVPAVNAFATPWGVLFGNSEFFEVTKTGQSDDVVLADSPHRPWCNKLLQTLGKHYVDREAPLFHLSLAQYEQLFRAFSKKYGLQPGTFTPHVIRHSGPSFDVIHKHRTFEQVQARGRWAAAQSVVRYRKPGRLLMEASKLPRMFQKYTEEPLQQALGPLLSRKWADASSQ
eukprot:Skav231462  [mRNA]  locus=scaffold1847:987492:988208:- [translate_table: standard]